MTLNQLIKFAQENSLDFDKELVLNVNEMEYTSFKALTTIRKVSLVAKKKNCTDAFDYTNYTKTVMEKSSEPNAKEFYEMVISTDLTK